VERGGTVRLIEILVGGRHPGSASPNQGRDISRHPHAGDANAFAAAVHVKTPSHGRHSLAKMVVDWRSHATHDGYLLSTIDQGESLEQGFAG
jgi:hypothetical protein